MTVVSNDPSWWSTIKTLRFFSYFVVASSTAMIYDWALTFGQEVELIWRQRWSLMTVLYIGVRYIGMPYAVISLLFTLPSVPKPDAVSNIMHAIEAWIGVVVNAMLCVIMIARLHAMYMRSRKILIFLVVVFISLTTASVTIAAIQTSHSSGEEYILSGTYAWNEEGGSVHLESDTWILGTVWEVLALCLAVWIAAKHFRELRRPSMGWTVGDCFSVLIKSHVIYFASFVISACLILGNLSPAIMDSASVGAEVYAGICQFVSLMQMFVLGPRLILSVREYHAELVAGSDEGTGMTTMSFQERVHVSTSSGV
ncbi:hypothetical protein DEU56DRAFT_294675 [Suillus clintonianus]|uniref:uncharacterized protein n=1 Tax=Suillus clintonianus TaxID=1904413 RepID=UPI001B87395C|nr:uncharacterized protein DEU56DRAFT_294675 [Suillus clintonianus]KAG2140136.1 hypothetical protein DEU56DRAFT_294675 [Suillus clintonianus]